MKYKIEVKDGYYTLKDSIVLPYSDPVRPIWLTAKIENGKVIGISGSWVDNFTREEHLNKTYNITALNYLKRANAHPDQIKKLQQIFYEELTPKVIPTLNDDAIFELF